MKNTNKLLKCFTFEKMLKVKIKIKIKANSYPVGSPGLKARKVTFN